MPRFGRRLRLAFVTLAVAVVLVGAAGYAVVRFGPLGGVVDLFADGRRSEAFRSLHERLPARSVAAGDAVWTFERDERPLPERFAFDGEERSLAGFLEASETTGLLVARDGVILHEAYAQGYDERSLATSFSLAKSVVGALVGIALERGTVRSLDDPIDAYVSELGAGGYAGVRVGDLLSMSSCVAWDEAYAGSGSDVMRLPLRLFGLRQSVVGVLRAVGRACEPGSAFRYASSDALALGLVLARANGTSPAALLEEAIWRPAGMEAAAAWNTDLYGQELTHAFLGATLRDYARFGRLYLHGGSRDGVQIVPADWVAASLRPTWNPSDGPTEGFGAGLGYGALWWLPDGGEGEFLAMGIWGQFLYVHPGRRIIVVKTSTDPDFATRGPETLAAFRAVARAWGDDPATVP